MRDIFAMESGVTVTAEIKAINNLILNLGEIKKMKIKKKMLITGITLEVFSFIGLLPLALLFFSKPDFQAVWAGNDPLVAGLLIAVGVSVLILPLIGFGLIFAAVFLPVIRGLRKNSRILAEGQPAAARILSVSETGTTINNQPLLDISLEVRPRAQPPFQADLRQAISLIYLASMRPGDFVSVKYLPGSREVAIVAPNGAI